MHDAPPKQPVTVETDDLLEACDAANAHAATLRERAISSTSEYAEAADRIDAAVSRLRRDALETAS